MPFTAEALKKDVQGLGIMLVTFVVTLLVMSTIVGDYTVLHRILAFLPIRDLVDLAVGAVLGFGLAKLLLPQQSS